MNEKTIPKTNTYHNWGHGYSASSSDDFPPPVLGSEGKGMDLPPNAPKIAGFWKVTEVRSRLTGRILEHGDDEQDEEEDDEDDEAGWPLVDHPHVGFTLRIEQSGNRVVITTKGVHRIIHDMVCDGTPENGVNDVSGSDHMTQVRATAEFVKDRKRGNVLTIHPLNSLLSKIAKMTSVVEYWREGDKIVWKFGLYVIYLEASGDSWPKSDSNFNIVSKAHTYANWGHGYGNSSDFPPLSLRGINVPLDPKAPDLRGTWKIVKYMGRMFDRRIDPDDKAWPKSPPPQEIVQRIEQAGNRIVITTGGDTEHKVIHDITCDGTFEGCADDVSGKDLVTRIRATGEYVHDKKRGKVHVLGPALNSVDAHIPGAAVERWREGEQMVWKYGFFRMFCERVDVGDDSTSSVVDDDRKRKRENK
jgi:hypothetical protein